MTERKRHALDIDPELAYLLAAESDDPVEAILVLHSNAEHNRPVDAEELMQRVCDPDDHPEMSFLPQLNVLIVRAKSRVVRALLAQPEVEIASANHGAAEAWL